MSEKNPRAAFAANNFEAALSALEDERRKLTELQTSIAEASTVVQSKDRMLSMTFNGRGELAKLTVNNTNYRRMAPTELAAVIAETLASGRAQALEKMGDLAGSEALPGVSFTDLAKGELDLNNVVNAFLGAALAVVPEDIMSPTDRARMAGES